MYKILLVEDDKIIAREIIKQLNFWGYDAQVVLDFSNVTKQFEEYMPHLVLMDISLPFYNGYHWCSEIRKVSKCPVIFISSNTDNMSIVMAINMGADDFINKPFDINVLVAKIQATFRRMYEYNDAVSMLKYKDVTLYLNDASIEFETNKIELTKNDFKILTILFENQNQIVERDLIMQKLWETDEFIDDNTLTVNINRLRKKLEDINLKDFIITKKGIGYMI